MNSPKTAMPARWAMLMLLLLLPAAAHAQTSPNTDIFLVSVDKTSKGKLKFGLPENITKREGYDNQPVFLPDGSGLLYTSIHEDGQSDVYRYSFTSGKHQRITKTGKVSEFSPHLLDAGNGMEYSVVRVEEDGKTQRLWRYSLLKTDEGIAAILPDASPVGYYCWSGSDNEVALFMVGDKTNDLQLADPKSGKTEHIAENVGRSLQKVPNRNAVSFVQKNGKNSKWQIKVLDFDSNKTENLANTLEDVEDYVWLPNGSLLMGKDGLLYQLAPGKDADWKAVADFSGTKAKKFYRIAVNPNGSLLALVAYD